MSLEEEIRLLRHAVSRLTEVLDEHYMTEFSEKELEELGPTTETASPPERMQEDISHLDGTISPQTEKTIQLIELSKRMGSPYLLNDDGKLIVDNRVMDEYNRLHIGDDV